MKYKPTTWVTDDLITAIKLNNIETGLERLFSIIDNHIHTADSITENGAKQFISYEEKEKLSRIEDGAQVNPDLTDYVKRPEIGSFINLQNLTEAIDNLDRKITLSLDKKIEAGYVTSAIAPVTTSLNNYKISNDNAIQIIQNDLNVKIDNTDTTLKTYFNNTLSDALSEYYKASSIEQLREIDREYNDARYLRIGSASTYNFYNSSGIVNGNVKIWFGTTSTSSGGLWTVNYSSAGFTQPPMVTATAVTRGDNTAAGDGAYASVHNRSITTTSCNGRLSSASSAGLLAAMVSVAGEGDINVIAIGI